MGYASRGVYQLFKEFTNDLKSNRQSKLFAWLVRRFPHGMSKINKRRNCLWHKLHSAREELPGHPLIVYNAIYNLHNTVLRLVYRADLYVPPAYTNCLWFLLECVVLSILFTPESSITGLANPDTILKLPLQLHLYTQSKLKYFLRMVLMMAHTRSLMETAIHGNSPTPPPQKPIKRKKSILKGQILRRKPEKVTIQGTEREDKDKDDTSQSDKQENEVRYQKAVH